MLFFDIVRRRRSRRRSAVREQAFALRSEYSSVSDPITSPQRSISLGADQQPRRYVAPVDRTVPRSFASHAPLFRTIKRYLTVLIQH